MNPRQLQARQAPRFTAVGATEQSVSSKSDGGAGISENSVIRSPPCLQFCNSIHVVFGTQALAPYLDQRLAISGIVSPCHAAINGRPLELKPHIERYP
jgi:hypothetical protein